MKYETEKLEAFLQDFMERKKIPGMSVCVNGSEGTIYKKGLGFCDMEKTKPVDTETIFGIASMTKSVTCACLAILESEGKLSFQDPACKYLPALEIPGTPREALLIHHLANMTSGLPPLPTLLMSLVSHSEIGPWIDPGVVAMGKRLFRTPMATIDEIIEYIKSNDDCEPLGAPGEYMSYSNDGYALLSSIVDVASGSTLEQFAHDRIFVPLGMTRSTFHTDEAKSMGNITSLFMTAKNQLYSSDDWDAAPPFRGSGRIKSTAEDMANYYEMLACDGVFRGKRILPGGCVARLCGRGFPETADITYCYGLMKRVFQDTVICEHGGSGTGISSMGGFLKDQGYSATVLINLGGVSPTVPFHAVLNMLLGLPLGTSHADASPQGGVPEKPNMYVGTYISKEMVPQMEVEVSLDGDGELYMKDADREGKLLFCDTTRFVFADGRDPSDQSRRVKFFVRDGQAWGIHYGWRMLQREEE